MSVRIFKSTTKKENEKIIEILNLIFLNSLLI